jgi:hypothetical protein
MIQVKHDGETFDSEPAENCVFCFQETRYWHEKKSVAVCERCAKERDSWEIPDKESWIRAVERIYPLKMGAREQQQPYVPPYPLEAVLRNDEGTIKCVRVGDEWRFARETFGRSASHVHMIALHENADAACTIYRRKAGFVIADSHSQTLTQRQGKYIGMSQEDIESLEKVLGKPLKFSFEV